MPASAFRLLAALAVLPAIAHSTDYYVRPSGDDADTGTAPTNAWRSIARVNAQSFQPGDRVLFEAGATFAGQIYLDANDGGTRGAPVVVGSHGVGRAIIDAGQGYGLYGYDCAHVTVQDLDFVGSGALTNGGSGVGFYTDRPDGSKREGITIRNVRVRRFRQSGISIAAWHRSMPGFRDVRITSVDAHDNGSAGIRVWGYFEPQSNRHAHEDVRIAHCTARSNAGDIRLANQNTGSGIVVSQTAGATIQHCVASHNGSSNRYGGGGPVGIWAWDSTRVTIQYNVSHHNRSPTTDGGGFGLDGGTTSSVLQYNYSYENDGAGYLLAQFVDAGTWGDNVVRFNVSRNDGRRNGFGGITAHTCCPSGLNRASVHNNTVLMAPAPTGTPVAVRLSAGVRDLKFWNNLLITSGGLPIVRGGSSPGVQFQGNAYWSSGAPFLIDWDGVPHASLPAWRSTAGQELLAGAPTGLHAWPRLFARGATALDDPMFHHALADVRPLATSPLRHAGLDLPATHGVDPGLHDFHGQPLLDDGLRDIGASRYHPNLLADGSFELGHHAWVHSGDAYREWSPGSWVLTLGPGHAGSYQLVTGWSPGQRYELGATARTDPGKSLRLGVTLYDARGRRLEEWVVKFPRSQTGFRSVSFVAPPGTETAWVWIANKSQNHVATLDDVILEPR